MVDINVLMKWTLLKTGEILAFWLYGGCRRRHTKMMPFLGLVIHLLHACSAVQRLIPYLFPESAIDVFGLCCLLY